MDVKKQDLLTVIGLVTAIGLYGIIVYDGWKQSFDIL